MLGVVAFVWLWFIATMASLFLSTIMATRFLEQLALRTGEGLTYADLGERIQRDGLFRTLRYTVRFVPARIRSLFRQRGYPDLEMQRRLAAILLVIGMVGFGAYFAYFAYFAILTLLS
jgi:hypothetical protein